MSELALHPADVELARALFADEEEVGLVLDLLEHVWLGTSRPDAVELLPATDPLWRCRDTFVSRVLVHTEDGGLATAEVRAGILPDEVETLLRRLKSSAERGRPDEPEGADLLAVWLLARPWKDSTEHPLELSFEAGGRAVHVAVLEPAGSLI